MIGLRSVLFGVGGSLLLTASFAQALEREKSELYSVYQMVSGTLGIIGDINGNLVYEDISDTIYKISGQNEEPWEMIRFSTGEDMIYESGDTSLDAPGTMPDEGTCSIRWHKEAGRNILFLSGILKTEEGNMRLFFLHHGRNPDETFTAIVGYSKGDFGRKSFQPGRGEIRR